MERGKKELGNSNRLVFTQNRSVPVIVKRATEMWQNLVGTVAFTENITKTDVLASRLMYADVFFSPYELECNVMLGSRVIQRPIFVPEQRENKWKRAARNARRTTGQTQLLRLCRHNIKSYF